MITSVDGTNVVGDDDLISTVARMRPGTSATLTLVRDGRVVTLPVKLAERPQRDRAATADAPLPPARAARSWAWPSVRSMRISSPATACPESVRGVVVWRVDAVSPALDADIERGDVILEIDRHAIHSVEDYDRAVARAAGRRDRFYVYKPSVDERRLSTVRIDADPRAARATPRRQRANHEAQNPGHRRRGRHPRFAADDPRSGLSVRRRRAPGGLALAQRERPDLVLLDIKMPGWTDGSAAQAAPSETLPVVMISGHGTTATAVDAIRSGPPTSSTSRSAASA